MYPEVLGLTWLHTYGVLVALAFLIGLWLASKLGGSAGLNPESVTNLGIYSGLSAIAGAKLMMFIVDFRYYAEHPDQIFTFATLQAGGVFYGGLIAALAVAFWYMRKTRLPPLRTADAFAPGIALGHGIGRLGCFSAGCCWGAVCHRPWAVTFTNPAAHDITGVPLNQPLHPTQLYEAAAELAIFGVLYWRFRRPHPPGVVIGLYLLLYSTARFAIEFFRVHEQSNPFDGPLNASQLISIGLFALGAWFTFATRRSSPPSPVAARG